ncbi:salicylate hydroxylase protein [Rutstroemia sp. NJR-2017a BVV2]|nr:salicylate hydroxylase protein [Rutstroemia sp. NJR-2017a BVV2]
MYPSLQHKMEAFKSAKRLRIAISGGGLAGATVASALQSNPYLDVNIYESAAQFSERGAAVGISVNGQRAFEEISTEVRDALDKAGAVKMNSSRMMIRFCKSCSNPILSGSLHANKKLVKIQDAPDGEKGILLTFADGSVEHADLLIDADGIHGFVRRYVLGDKHPETDAKFAGFWDCRSLVPFEKAKKLLGEEYFKEDRQYGWIGDGAMLLHDVLDNGKTVQCVAAIFSDGNSGFEDSKSWKTPIDRKKLEDALATWTECPITQGMIDLLLENPEPLAYAEYHHLNAPTYVKGNVCLMGDAAHAMTPWQGSGAGMAFEDAMGPSDSARQCSGCFALAAALQAYDTTCRPRTQRVVASSREAGVILCGSAPGIGVEPDKLLASLATRLGFIHELDMKAHKAEARSLMHELLNGDAHRA